jgi:hypothetical protein
MQTKLRGVIIVDFEIKGKLLIRYSAFVTYWRKTEEYNDRVHQLFRDSGKAYDPVSRQVLYGILFESFIHTRVYREFPGLSR